MKLGVIISAFLHALALSWGLFYLAPPKSHQALEVEALPVDIIPVSSITQVQQGETTASIAEVSAPKPTERPDPVEDAQTVGENSIDLEANDSARDSERLVEDASEPQQADVAEPLPKPEEAPVPQPAEKPEPVPSTEVAALPQKPQEVAPDPVAEAIASSEPSEPEFELPKSVPTPTQRPNPPQAQTARTPERKNNPDRQNTAKLASARESEFNADEIAALLNRDDAAGGGAQRSQREAALGGRTSTAGERLTQSEMDALRTQIQECWNIIPGMDGGGEVRVEVTMRLDPSGSVQGEPDVYATGGETRTRNILADGARRAIKACGPYELPREKYDTWADVKVNFDPSQMF